MGLIGAIWGVSGVVMLLGFAIFRLTPVALDSFNFTLAWYHWLALVANILFMLHAEGYRGFQLNFSPRVAVRCRHLYHNPTPLHVLLAPLFAMAYFHTTPRQQRVSIILTLFIVILVIAVGYLPQPWRGIVDWGVVAGLTWGLVSLLYFVIKAIIQPDFKFSAQLPGSS